MTSAITETRPRIRFSTSSKPLTAVFSVAVLLAAFRGVQLRGEFVFSPEYGVGYALGIVGGLMMLLLLTYPLRKHLHFMGRMGAVRHWFRIHMLLGIVGPLCILFHCNFSLGAVNSNIALLCMALMVASGMVGRFIYTRIHYGLYGHKATLQGLQRDKALAEQMLRKIGGNEQVVVGALQSLDQMQHYAQQPLGFAARSWRLVSISPRMKLLAWRIQRQLRATNLSGDVREYIDNYVDVMQRISGFVFFDRLFALWHTLHMPIFFMLVITGLVHVWAVHNY
jgi:hypothetical protein